MDIPFDKALKLLIIMVWNVFLLQTLFIVERSINSFQYDKLNNS